MAKGEAVELATEVGSVLRDRTRDSAFVDALRSVPNDALLLHEAIATSPPLVAALLAQDIVLRPRAAGGSPTSIPVEQRLLPSGQLQLERADALLLPPDTGASAYVSAAAAGQGTAVWLRLSAAGVEQARVFLCGVRPAPLQAVQLQATLQGRRVSPALLRRAGETARLEAQPLGGGSLVDEGALLGIVESCRQALARAAQRAAATAGVEPGE